MARSVFLRRSLTVAGTGMLAGLGLMAVAAPAQAAAPVARAVSSSAAFVSDGSYPGWQWCPYGYYGWHHEGLLSGLLDNTGYLLGDLL